ncbi:MAG: four-carbon acid sugar kinase family protein [Ilumatobacteraceae bacterium]|nr:four-carbon acid sugar kinase family protein [Ilumatobacteraceae bacterium]
MTADTPDRLISFYGDDFTGSSSAMEVLAFAGVPTVMFLEPPGPDELARFPDVRAIGIAGVARSRTPEWMRTRLPDAFRALADFGAPVAHYKVCSTFDSSPTVGSIGTAIDVGAPILGNRWHPLVVGAPAIRRYQAFGNLFAGIDSRVHRLDRHPVMRRHPVTPMDESDLTVHLARQTDRSIGLVDLASMAAGDADTCLAGALADGAEIVAIDVIDDTTLTEAGRLIWRDGHGPVFAVGSQGIEYALVAHWRAIGLLPSTVETPTFAPVDQILCVSGSCSSVTAAQIATAAAAGFTIIDLDVTRSVDEATWAEELSRATEATFAALAGGNDVIVATAGGPIDEATARLTDALRVSGVAAETANDRIGSGLGRIVADVRRTTRLPRVAIAGGDTSGHAITALDATALSAIAPLAPGAPLCAVHSDDADIDGLEVTLKGGQMGSADFFELAKRGLA